ncbi:hypothetical protein DFQ28_006449 [Apophysomyces sp. BC1034]|nr:hypothetical protein DFQ30_004325 [Apophysomyces sp. BC1015]KAG0182467.1 hypothetical protein DFQ29_003895 [Apophysomyces sp. BC1021]KAG0193075.1 hypothetical protein DFQ28_006449 [Apophysomyces sp. BC1034]
MKSAKGYSSKVIDSLDQLIEENAELQKENLVLVETNARHIRSLAAKDALIQEKDRLLTKTNEAAQSKKGHSPLEKQLVVKTRLSGCSENFRFVYSYPAPGASKKQLATFAKLRRKIKRAFALPSVFCFKLTYIDVDGDDIIMSNDTEFRDAIQHSISSSYEADNYIYVVLGITVTVKDDKTSSDNSAPTPASTPASTPPAPSLDKELLQLKDMLASTCDALASTCTALASTADIVTNFVRYVECKQRPTSYSTDDHSINQEDIFKSTLFPADDDSDEIPPTSYPSDYGDFSDSPSTYEDNCDIHADTVGSSAIKAEDHSGQFKEEEKDTDSISDGDHDGSKHGDNDTDDCVLI